MVLSPRPRAARAIAAASLAVLLVTALAGCGGGDGGDSDDSDNSDNSNDSDGGGLTITSAAFDDGGEIPDSHACAPGDGESPPLAFGDIPAEAASLALVMRDESIRGFLHWVVVDIPVTTTEVAAGTPPDGGTVLLTYGPVCPGSGNTHTYVLTLYALAEPTIDAGSIARDVAVAVADAAIATGQLSATYTAP